MSDTQAPLPVRSVLSLERSTGLDKAVAVVQPVAAALTRPETLRQTLQGQWLGHALHPLMTMLPIGTWVSTNLLDALGGEDARPAARTLLGIGIVGAVPTAVTGVAEWADAGPREKRVGVVHAAANSTALMLYIASWLARGRGRHRRGSLLALAGTSAAGLGGFLGGHLTEARKVSSRHPAFEETDVTVVRASEEKPGFLAAT
jgi:uncharacterized membrane protein